MLVSHTSRIPRKKVALVVLDALVCALALVFAIALRLGWINGAGYIGDHVVAILISWAVFLTAFYVCGLYEADRLLSLSKTLTSALLAVSLGAMVVAAIFYAVYLEERAIGRGIFIGFTVFAFVGVMLTRLMYMGATRRGFLAQRCLIIGTSQEARRVIDLVHRHPHAGLKILGIIHCGAEREAVGKFVEDYPVLGSIEALNKFVDLYNIDRLILAASIDFEPVLLQRLRSFRYRGLALVDFVALYEELAQEIPLDYINDEWLFMASMNNSRFHVRRLKRLTDVLAAFIGLVLTAPLFLVAAILVKLTSKGPCLYRQERLGRDSEPFMVLKFRTMRVDAESASGPVWATEDDPRITWIGKWFRKFRVDEIPQLWNVLRGDMSLVGPRPERPVFIKKLSEKIPFYSERLLVPPGVTGWAQVMHPYAASIEESRRKLEYDLYYIKHMSFLLDVFIMLKTVKTILFGRERSVKKPPAKSPAAEAEEIKTEMLFFNPGAKQTNAPATGNSNTKANG